MNFDDILNAAAEFSSEGVGAMLLEAAIFLYELLYPANAGPAGPVDVPA
ncbi:hypothetical protein [Corynebacterium sp.]